MQSKTKPTINVLEFSAKNIFRIFLDACLLIFSFILATFLRLEGQITSTINNFIWNDQLFKVLPVIVLIKVSVLVGLGTYRRFWRYTEISDLIKLSQALLFAAAIILLPRVFGLSPQSGSLMAISYGIVAIDFLLCVLFLTSIRVFRSYLVEQRNIKKRLRDLKGNTKNTLIIGAGEAAIEVINSIKAHPELGLNVVGALDDDVRKHGMRIAGNIKVLGKNEDVKFWVSELVVDQLIIATQSLNEKEKRKITILCSETEADVRIVPSVDQLAGGKVSVEQIRKLSMEDLLGREAINLNTDEVLRFLKNKRVLVTGAGGSIGKELCYQLIKNCSISSLCLLGKGENSIFETLQTITEINNQNIEIITRIADIRNYDRINEIFTQLKPEVVFHAAAHKHVHLMEFNACEAFDNNILGTRNVAELSGLHQVQAFVLISTDKAVNPTSIMGCTKNLAEKITLRSSQNFPNTKFTAVRFGNVLGSRGSVIKVWEKQLASRQSITVTHPEAIRYFMTIPEASGLVIQAAAQASNREILVLDMGEPVKIYDLAKQFIQLSGFSLEDIGIEIIGLKEGEKLYEELLTSEEFVDLQVANKIYRARIDHNLKDQELDQEITRLTHLAKLNLEQDLKTELRSFIKKLQSDKISL